MKCKHCKGEMKVMWMYAGTIGCKKCADTYFNNVLKQTERHKNDC